MWRDTSEDMHSAYANEMTQLMQEHYKSLKGKNSWSELFDKFHYSSMVDLYWIFGLIFIEYLVWSLLHIWFDLYCIFGSIFIAYLVWSSLHIWFDLYCIFGLIFIAYLVRSLLHICLIFIGYLVWSLLHIWFDLYWIFGLIFIGNFRNSKGMDLSRIFYLCVIKVTKSVLMSVYSNKIDKIRAYSLNISVREMVICSPSGACGFPPGTLVSSHTKSNAVIGGNMHV